MSLPSESWFYARGGQRYGPVTLRQLQGLLQQGHVHRDTDLVWAEGQEDWKPASRIARLVSRSAHAVVDGGPARPAGPALPFVKPARFGVLLGLTLGAVPATIGGAALMAYGFALSLEPHRSLHAIPELLALLGLLITIAGCGLGLAALVFSCVYLYRAWFAIQPFGAPLTPGIAVGYLFIPVFGFYWCFRSLRGWAHHYHRIVASDPNFQAAPPVTSVVFQVLCVLLPVRVLLLLMSLATGSLVLASLAHLASLATLVAAMICAYQICTVINYFHRLHMQA